MLSEHQLGLIVAHARKHGDDVDTRHESGRLELTFSLTVSEQGQMTTTSSLYMDGDQIIDRLYTLAQALSVALLKTEENIAQRIAAPRSPDNLDGKDAPQEGP